MHLTTLRKRWSKVADLVNNAGELRDEDPRLAAQVLDAAADRLEAVDSSCPWAWSPLAWVARSEAVGEVVNGVRRAPVNAGALRDWANALRAEADQQAWAWRRP